MVAQSKPSIFFYFLIGLANGHPAQTFKRVNTTGVKLETPPFHLFFLPSGQLFVQVFLN